MNDLKENYLSYYDYELPEELIAQTALKNRLDSRLLYLDKNTGETKDNTFPSLLNYLRPDDLIIMNNTHVSAFHLNGKRETGGKISLLVLSPSTHPRSFLAMAKPAKKLCLGSIIYFENNLTARVTNIIDESHRVIEFDESPDWQSHLDKIKLVPLPPYIKTEMKNDSRYQTVYSKHEGSAAAPTAGLHFTEEFINRIKEKGCGIDFINLNVGIDTFRPIQEEFLPNIKMHGETCTISEDLADKINHHTGRIIAVGTTTVRTLESFAIQNKKIDYGKKTTQTFIYPGYQFKIVNGIITNFHLPKTTMLCMISAMASRDKVLQAYKVAVTKKYRFLSFGDSMLIL